MVRDPSIVSPSLTGVFIGGGHNKHQLQVNARYLSRFAECGAGGEIAATDERVGWAFHSGRTNKDGIHGSRSNTRTQAAVVYFTRLSGKGGPWGACGLNGLKPA